ncbi:hypothetical protein M422DRAFT_275442 [Sphaerobolus stellatus SS14]|uniref:Unplaced genomic scaffold SPHSTscaffold_493, whole genome shotgun sequence n=1 Tax=Sphaerobolus stellatus (strain SS14) TaxID=990650 RepID=A0A0C9UFE8_SPHS4|nr:hypothetical protein M422DRAFT_275442 [Sphaerobolus stellatus SS14]
MKEEDVKQQAEAAARKVEEDAEAAAKAAEEDECEMDANSEGEDEVDQDGTPKSKSRLIVDLESEEEIEEVKTKRRKAKGKAIDTEYKRNMVLVDYVGCPEVPVIKMCEGCKVPENAKYQRPCIANVQMDANDQIFYVRSKDCCFLCLMRSNVCLFTCKDEANFIMLEATNDKELQAKLRKLCDKQDAFQKQKDKEKAERNKMLGNSMKVETSKKVEVNVKALGSNTKVVSEEDNIVVEARPKRARTVANNARSSERIPSVTESLDGINQALIETINILGDTRAVSESQAKTLRRIETCMVNLQSAMQMYVGQVHYSLGELEKQARNWAAKDEEGELADEEVFSQPEEKLVRNSNVVSSLMVEELEDKDEEIEEVHEEIEEVHDEIEEVHEEVEGPCEEGREGCEVEDDKTMKDPEADKL